MAIVDDERGLVEVYRRVLEIKDIPVCFVAYDGDEALRLFAEHNPKPGVVLLDYRMPTIDGLEVARQMMAADGGVRVIIASADEGIEEDAVKAGAVMFLRKPAGVKDILNAVETAAAR